MPAGHIQNYRNPIHSMHGIFVGINEYDINRDPKKYGSTIRHNVQNLRGCVNDATDLAKAFFGATKPRMLLNEEASRANIFKEISDFINQRELFNSNAKTAAFQSAQLNGYLLIISFSGHGLILPETDEFCFAPYDFDPSNRLGSVFSTITLINAMSSLARLGARVLLIIDACNAGGVPYDISKYSGLLSRGGVACLSSCSASELSMEKITENRSSGVFTHYMAKGLNGEAARNGVVTLRDLYDFTRENVTKASPNQHPILIGTLEGNTVLKKLDNHD